jgi:hypothetical protein
VPTRAYGSQCSLPLAHPSASLPLYASILREASLAPAAAWLINLVAVHGDSAPSNALSCGPQPNDALPRRGISPHRAAVHRCSDHVLTAPLRLRLVQSLLLLWLRIPPRPTCEMVGTCRQLQAVQAGRRSAPAPRVCAEEHTKSRGGRPGAREAPRAHSHREEGPPGGKATPTPTPNPWG